MANRSVSQGPRIGTGMEMSKIIGANHPNLRFQDASLSEAPLEAASPEFASADLPKIGDAVKVFSKSLKVWCPGEIESVEAQAREKETMVKVTYSDGKMVYSKAMAWGHANIRRRSGLSNMVPRADQADSRPTTSQEADSRPITSQDNSGSQRQEAPSTTVDDLAQAAEKAAEIERVKRPSMDWPLSREEKKCQALHLYERDVKACDELLQQKDRALNALKQEIKNLRRASTGSSITTTTSNSPNARWYHLGILLLCFYALLSISSESTNHTVAEASGALSSSVSASPNLQNASSALEPIDAASMPALPNIDAPSYALYMGPGSEFCNDGVFSESSSSRQADCELRCSGSTDCKYISLWSTGGVNWCRLTTGCTQQAVQAEHTISVYAKQEAQEKNVAAKHRRGVVRARVLPRGRSIVCRDGSGGAGNI